MHSTLLHRFFRQPLRMGVLGLIIVLTASCGSTPEPKATIEGPDVVDSGDRQPISATPATGPTEDEATQETTDTGNNATGRFQTAGMFSWNELTTRDVEGAKRFYSALLGWRTTAAPQTGESAGTPYASLRIGTQEFGEITAMSQDDASTTAYWMSYVTVEDVDVTAQQARALGGKVLIPPTDIEDFGRVSLLEDPQGAAFYVIQYFEDTE
jgi:predicted enzyme related to lactoylglutathione lyase